MTNIVGFAWESALFALRNHTMQPRKEMTLLVQLHIWTGGRL